ncbi:MAG TPA: zinc metalloprotease HtpX [Gammaproteobacteria bacterium]|nr:zinc metalloprotease HtpX [Gammaproteobacteria bacterium]
MNEYNQSANDWRGVIRRNNRNSVIVIGIFILMYVALGLLVDTFIYSQRYFQAPLGPIFHQIITLKLFPYATLISTFIAIISLWIVFIFHDKIMLLGTEYHEITPESAANLQEKQFYNIIEEMKVAAGLRFMPRVFIIEADYMNAFASGYSEKSAMVAITRGLLEKLDRDEIQAVMAHEISHVRHMDIKLTLMASILSNIMLVAIDVLFWNAYFSGSRRREGSGGSWLVLVIIVLRYVLPLVNMMLMLFLSRTREYMADAGCVELTRNNEPLARALLKIEGDTQANVEDYTKQYNQSTHDSLRRESYIYDPSMAGIGTHNAMSEWFSTHPSLENRLAALGYKPKK